LRRASGDLTGAREAEVEAARRVALPFASFIFALVGAPLGVRPQRSGGKGVGFALAIGIIFAYWVSFQFGLLLGNSGALPPFVAVALPNLAGLVAAVYLNRRVLR
jgi:lipopolysaccharide export system permease protein